MKIRKNKKLNLRGYFKDYPHVHNCKLNQSLWDVITTPNRGSLRSPPPQLLRRGNSFFGNCSLGGHGLGSKAATDEDSEDSLNSDEKVAAEMMTKLVVESPVMKKSDKTKVEEKFKFKLKRPTKIHGSDIVSSSKTKRVEEKNNVLQRGPSKRAKVAKGGSAPGSSSKSHELYYYTGFGPSWGKKRGNQGSNENNVEGNSNGGTNIVEYLELNEEEDEEKGGKKKMKKKPKKERSLKSLMRDK